MVVWNNWLQFGKKEQQIKNRRYTTNDRCELNNIFESLNDWRVVNLEISKNAEIDDDGLAEEIPHGIERRMLEKINKSNYGAMITDVPVTDGYYIVE